MYLILSHHDCDDTARPWGLYATRAEADAEMAEWAASAGRDGHAVRHRSLPAEDHPGRTSTLPLAEIEAGEPGCPLETLYLYAVPVSTFPPAA